jgi:glycosyltransferase involved in cell wall biosynthesis
MELTVGMATYRDFDGVYFTLQALRLYQDMAGVEILVVDNYGCEATRAFVEGSAGGRYVLAPRPVGTSAPRDLVFREARAEAVLCIDSHVLLPPGVLGRLKRFYRAHPDCLDLLQGPMVDDDLHGLSSHLEPVWRDGFWGVWAADPRLRKKPGGKPFDVPMHGLGLFSCRKAAWPGFHPDFRGFGGEEGYIHQKFRNLGRRCLCLPWLRWVHRFPRPAGVPYPVRLTDRIANYLIGHRDVGLDETPVLQHFRATASEAEVLQALRAADAALPRPASAVVPAVLRAPPLISCLCPTFGRCGSPWQHLLEEAVEGFLRQTDVHSELLILNDHPAQELVCHRPRVRVVNHPQRFRTLGEKYNTLVSLASGDLLAPWEDDDISLPHRLELSRERLGKLDYFNPRSHWFLDRHGLHADRPGAVGHNLSLFRRRAWQAVGGYPAVTGSQDAAMDRLLTGHPRVRCRVEEGPLPLPEWYYIYRWGASPSHLSARRDMQGYYDSLAAAPAAAGRFALQPHWRQDYAALVAAAGAPGQPGPGGAGALEGDPGGRPGPRHGGCDTTYKRAAAYLAGIGLVEEWGCGTAYFKRFLPPGCYRGIGGRPSAWCDQATDLASYTSAADGIFVRRVLEHDLRWRRILRNALASFRRRMVLVVYTPFVRATEEHHRVAGPAPGTFLPEIRFSRGDLVREVRGLSVRLEEGIPTDSPFGREHVFYLCKDGPA